MHRPADGDEAEQEREKPDQPGAKEAEVVAGGGEDDVDGVPGGSGEEVAAEMAILRDCREFRVWPVG